MSGPQVIIRPARTGDEDGIARVFRESAEHHARLDPERYVIPEGAHIVTRYQQRQQHGAKTPEDAITFVADLQGEIIGFIDAQLNRPFDAMHRNMLYGNISEIAVSLAYRRKGIGKKLLLAAENWARRSGAEFTFLEYHIANVEAAAFYTNAMGYREASVTLLKRL